MQIIFIILVLLVPNFVVAKPIVLGQSGAFSGTSGDLGLEVQKGLLAAFSEINENGGVKGRNIVLLSMDDSYEPYLAVENTNRLLDTQSVFSLIGNIGTPTTLKILPHLGFKNAFLFCPITGAVALREQNTPSLIHFRASYHQEIEKIVEHITEVQKFTKIACFYQNDSYGQSGRAHLEEILEEKGLELVASGHYQRNTVAVLGALNTIHNSQPEAIVLVGSYLACAEFISLSKLRYPRNTAFYNLSFVGTMALKKALRLYSDNVYVSEVVPMIEDDSHLLIQNYQKSLKTFDKTSRPSFLSLEGYIIGRLFGEIAGNVQGELTKKKFLSLIQKEKVFQVDDMSFCLAGDSCEGAYPVSVISLSPRMRKAL